MKPSTKNPAPRLRLSRETLRRLVGQELHTLAGGWLVLPETNVGDCNSQDCMGDLSEVLVCGDGVPSRGSLNPRRTTGVTGQHCTCATCGACD